MNRVISLAVVALVAAACAHASQAADMRADFSTTSNPNGAWFYASSNSSGLSLMTSNVATPGGVGAHVLSWWHPDSFDYPNVGVYTATPNDFLSLHPGDDLRSSVGYKASADGPYHFSGEFRALDPGGTGTTTDFLIQAPDASTIASGALRFYAGPISHAFSFDEPLLAGQSVVFSVGNGGDGKDFDNTGLQLSVTPSGVVPEPSAGLLAAMSASACLISRRGRRLLTPARRQA